MLLCGQKSPVEKKRSKASNPRSKRVYMN